MSQHWCSDEHVNTLPFEEWLKISANTPVAACYQVNLAIDIPNIAENDKTHTFSLVINGNPKCIFKCNISHVVWRFFDGQIISMRKCSELIVKCWENSV